MKPDDAIDVIPGSTEHTNLSRALWRYINNDPDLLTKIGEHLPRSIEFTKLTYCWKSLVEEGTVKVRYELAMTLLSADGSPLFIVERMITLDPKKVPWVSIE